MGILSDFFNQRFMFEKAAGVAVTAFISSALLQQVTAMNTEIKAGEFTDKNGAHYQMAIMPSAYVMAKTTHENPSIAEIYQFVNKDKIVALTVEQEKGPLGMTTGYKAAPFQQPRLVSSSSREFSTTFETACQIAKQLSEVQRGWVAIDHEGIRNKGLNFIKHLCR